LLNSIFLSIKKIVIIKLLVKGYTKKPTSEWIKREKDRIKQDLNLFNKKRKRKDKKGCPL
jgi:FtsZ-interacting cell division protein ZipA